MLRNNGIGGTRAPITTTTGTHAGEMSICDLDGNRTPDMVSIDASRRSVTVYVAVSSVSFVRKQTIDFAIAGFVAGLWGLFLDPFFLGFGEA